MFKFVTFSEPSSHAEKHEQSMSEREVPSIVKMNILLSFFIFLCLDVFGKTIGNGI